MADIQLAGIYDSKKDEFGTMGAGISRFQTDFIDATNRSINRINRKADLSSRISRISKTEDSVTLDEKYEDVLSDGITLYLIHAGRRPAKNAETLVNIVQSRFLDGIDEIRQDIMNLASTSDTSDDTTDLVGLGALG